MSMNKIIHKQHTFHSILKIIITSKQNIKRCEISYNIAMLLHLNCDSSKLNLLSGTTHSVSE